ncbi:hypothetical protein NA57DRAFT_50707 [Rhizodiscina lignyota]|uniref:Extracellular serine-rich protein n=1 Tax=Rhizodiscina lignyota TaxID=1504668 RepID=A0A9P4MAM7_9PEZI|nr:hypothetical protein NA57DRAFT_50707 [Rhizodiscina lignyota]
MHFAKILSTSIILAGSAYAQSSSSSSSSSSSGSSSSATASSTSSAASGMTTVHVVQVSDSSGALTFSPNSLTAGVGDMIQYQFYKGNHSVVMASFDQPCVPIQESDPSNAANAFFSGFMPVENTSDFGRLTYTIMVKDTNPMWYYCAQGKHCEGGMVGVINP